MRQFEDTIRSFMDADGRHYLFHPLEGDKSVQVDVSVEGAVSVHHAFNHDEVDFVLTRLNYDPGHFRLTKVNDHHTLCTPLENLQ